MFLSADDNRGGTLTAGGGTSISMSTLALEEELLVEWDDPVRLSLPKNLLTFLQKINKRQNSWNGLEIKMSAVSHSKVIHPRVSRS
jgi:hypothetical protein